MRLAYLSGYEKDYNESIYQALAKGYDQYSSEDTLEAICKYVMKGNPRKTEYFRWFSLAVEHGLRPVSYTHLDVYKRQGEGESGQ